MSHPMGAVQHDPKILKALGYLDAAHKLENRGRSHGSGGKLRFQQRMEKIDQLRAAARRLRIEVHGR